MKAIQLILFSRTSYSVKKMDNILLTTNILPVPFRCYGNYWHRVFFILFYEYAFLWIAPNTARHRIPSKNNVLCSTQCLHLHIGQFCISRIPRHSEIPLSHQG